MDDIFELLNYAYARTKDVKNEYETYDEDSEADHSDGKFSGKKEAYNEIVKKCAVIIAAQAERL